MAAPALENHVTNHGIPQRIVARNGAIVAYLQTIAAPSRFGVVLMQLAAIV